MLEATLKFGARTAETIYYGISIYQLKTTTSLSVSPCAFFFSLLFLSWSLAFS